MLKRGMFIALLAAVIAAGCSEVKKSDDDQAGSSAATSGSGGDGAGGDGAGGTDSAGSGGKSGDGAGGDGSGGTDSAGSGGESGADAAGSGGESGDGASGAGAAAVDAGPVDGIPCGQVVCTAEECCSDPFSSTCGAPLPTTSNTCLPPPPEGSESIEGCPAINIMNIFMLPSCCTEDNQCGIAAQSFGATEPCTSLETAQSMAEAMGFGAFISFPDPQACP